MENFIKINVGGSEFYAEKSSLLKYPSTRLGALDMDSHEFITEKGYLFFNRNPESFQIILDFYRHDYIHIPDNICSEIVRRELIFWKIPLDKIAKCCRSRILKSDNKLETIQRIDDAFGNKRLNCDKEIGRRNMYSHKLWLVLEEPLSSRVAKLYNNFYLLIVLMSVALAFLLTYPDFRIQLYDLQSYRNLTVKYKFNENNPKEVNAVTTTLPGWWYALDKLLITFFTLEFFARLFVSPSKRNFLTSVLNVLDIVLNISMWIRVLFENSDLAKKYTLLGWIVAICYCMISLRLFRFLRISKQYNELRVLLLSLRSSCKELFLLLVIFVILVALFANFIYYAEFREPATFPTVFSGVWWAVVTLTTVGYGDRVPASIGGKLVGSACATCGLIFLALPIAIIASKFNEHYGAMKDFINFRKLFTKMDVTITVDADKVDVIKTK